MVMQGGVTHLVLVSERNLTPTCMTLGVFVSFADDRRRRNAPPDCGQAAGPRIRVRCLTSLSRVLPETERRGLPRSVVAAWRNVR